VWSFAWCHVNGLKVTRRVIHSQINHCERVAGARAGPYNDIISSGHRKKNKKCAYRPGVARLTKTHTRTARPREFVFFNFSTLVIM